MGSKYFPCTILDLTPDGARITVPGKPLLPTELHLINIKGQYAQRALVAWAKDAEAGLKFLEYIDLAKGGSPDLVRLLVKHASS